MQSQTLRVRIAALPENDRVLLTLIALAGLIALLLGLSAGGATALTRAGMLPVLPESGYRMLTLHGASVFFHWLAFAQTALMLAFAAAEAPVGRGLAARPLAWGGAALMTLGWLSGLVGALTGQPLLYDGAPDAAADYGRENAAFFYLGYLALGAGLVLVSSSAIATLLREKREGRVQSWSAPAFATVAWAGLVLVSAIAALNAFAPALLWALDLGPEPVAFSVAWHVLFHNLHYLPLMGTALVWYMMIESVTGARAIFGAGFSKLTFASYMLFVPPTSLYHMFLDPNLSEAVRVLGSLLALFTGVPTILVFLILTVSLEAHARAVGAIETRAVGAIETRAIGVAGIFGKTFGWLRRLPWRDPTMAAIGFAVFNLALGGVFGFVLIQEKLAPLLSDTFFVPGYFHFLTLGTVTLTLLAGLAHILPALTGRAVAGANLRVGLPAVMSLGLLLFGGAGVAAGLAGLPRRVMDASYDGLAPAIWSKLYPFIGIGGGLMALALGVYVLPVLVSILWGKPAAKTTPQTFTGISPATGAAWTGPLAVAVLLVGMYAATSFAFEVLQSLPLAASGGGGH